MINKNWTKSYPLLEDIKEESLDNNSSLKKILNFVEENKQIIDFGCATGYLANLLSRKGCTVTGVEINPDAAKIAEEHCEEVIVADLDVVSVTEILPNKKFDVAIFGDVLEHLRNPWQLLAETKNILKPDGYVVASIPNIAHGAIRLALLQGKFEYSELGILDNTHLRFFTGKTIEELFDNSGYLIKVTDRTTLPIFTNDCLVPQVNKNDFNLETIQKVEADSDAQTVQFILKAVPSSVEERYAFVREQHSQLIEREEKLLSQVESVNQELEQTQDKLEQSQSQLQQTRTELERSQAHLEKFYSQLEQDKSQLEQKQKEIVQLQTQIQESSTQLRRSQTTIYAMESSKFWQLRSLWFRFRHALGVTDDSTPFYKILFSNNKKKWHALITPQSPQQVNLEIPTSDDINYQKWLNINYPTSVRLKKMADAVETFSYKPTIGIIMPVFNTPEHFLREAIESVLKQVYPYWELCIADDSSPETWIRKVLEEYSAKDSRIKVVFRTENGHISRCSNSALEIATGEFIALLDHDDLLTPDALYEVALLLNKHPQADMIYSDEDKIDESGKLRDPFFKPDWCPDSFLSRNYTCHFGTYRREIVNKIGGFRSGYEGSQDYDLILRFTEKTNNIFHIPKILYHWRIHPESCSSETNAKPYAAIAAEKALTDALERRNEIGRVTEAASLIGHYIIRYKISDYKLVSIIIPTRDLGEILDKCLKSIFEKTVYPNYEVVLIDNGSEEQKTLDIIAKWEQQEPKRFRSYRYDIPFNYSKINNYGVEQAKGDYLLFLNNDIEVITPDWIDAMVEQAQRNSIGTVGTLLLYPDNTIQHAGVVLGIGGVAGHSHKNFPANSPGYFDQILTVNNYSAVTGACLMCRRETFETVGGFEEELTVAFNDIDLCLKFLERGYKNIYLPHAMLYHHESKSRGYENTPEKRARFSKEIGFMQNKWKEIIENDPCYNPHLSRNHEDYGIRV